MQTLLDDVRLALRLMLRYRSFSITALAALALGIGATSAIGSVIYAVLFKPLPYQNADRLVRVYENNAPERFHDFPLSPADFLDYRKENGVFESIGTYARQDQQFGGEHPERLIGVRVSYGFFHVFGARPMLGRAFTQAEEQTPGGTEVAILSYGAWKRILGGDSFVIGKIIRLNDSPTQIVGVMAPGFEHVSGGYRLPRGEAVDVWLPFNMLANAQRVSRANHFCNTIARVKADLSIEKAQAAMNVIASGLEGQYPDDKNWRVQLQPLREDLVGGARPTLLILGGAVGFVLLIACVNVANLLLARATAREREMAIRTAVGASRGRLVRQMLTESVLLASAGGALGLILAWWGVQALIHIAPRQVPRLNAIALDARIVLGTAAIALLCGLLFGIAPALAASTTRLRSSRSRGVFVVSEVALTCVLLIGAGLLLRTFLALGRVDPGFHARGVLTMSTALSYPKLTGARRYAAFYERFVEALAQVPGVTAAGAASNLPWTGANDNALIGIEGRPRPANSDMHAYYVSVSPDYLRAIGVPLLAGRWLRESDHFDAPKVLLINRTLALRYWPSIEASLGQRLYTMRDANTIDAPMTIVGVVGDVKDSPTDALAQPITYEPFLQSPSFGNYVVLRARTDADALIPAVRQVALQMGNDLSIQEIRSMESVVAGASATETFALEAIGLFAILALALALIGIYGVMSYAAGRRTREMAIRSALGAAPFEAARLLLLQGMRFIFAGLAVGALAAIGLTRVLAGLLYQVGPTDPLTFGAIAVLLMVAGTAACVAPAHKALKVDPMEALRHE